MALETPVVMASSLARQEGLLRALQSVFHMAGGPPCERAIVGWTGPPPPSTLFGSLADRVEVVPGYGLHEVLRLVERVADAAGFAFFLRDDEVLVAGPQDRQPGFITNDLRVLEVPGVWIAVHRWDGPGLWEPRFFARGFRFPPFIHPTLYGMGHAHVGGGTAAGSYHLTRRRFQSAGAALRLNVGCGSRTFSNWRNIDHDPECDPDVLLDVGLKTLPYENGTVQAIYASHLLDHLTFSEGLGFLQECHRVLEPDGVLRIVVCDLAVFVKAYQDRNLEQFNWFQPIDFVSARTQGLKLGMVACGSLADRHVGSHGYGGHKLLFDGEAACEMLERAGFQTVALRSELEYAPAFADVDDIFPDHSVYCEAVR